MNLTIKKPGLQRYIDDLVRAGRYPSPEAVVEDALMRAMVKDVELTEEDLAAIQESERQLDSGQAIDSKEVRTRMEALFRKAQP